jgi:secreted PhoX family phosphatase
MFRSVLAANFVLAGLAVQAPAFLFNPIDTNFRATQHYVPSTPVKSKILFRGQVDTVVNKSGQKALSKGDNDFIGFVPINGRSDSGYVIQNHEQVAANTLLGHGGGMSVFTAHFKNDDWVVADHPNGKFRQVDFSGVGGTIANCGGAVTPWGTVTTGEEWMYASNSALRSAGFTDTTDVPLTSFNGEPISRNLKRWQALNWIVEVDPASATAIKKHYNMGRFAHEMGYSMPDGKTVYLADDATPAVFFKFVSDTVGNYNKGKLYAYQQSADGQSGTWLEMPMNLDSMINIRAVAFRRGATAFTRHEWITAINGKVYITETGNDNPGTAHRSATRTGAKLPMHLSTAARMNADSSMKPDYFGRILRFDPATDKMDVFLEGGPASAGNPIHLANPDGLTSVTLGNKHYLVIAENLNGTSQGRVSSAANSAGRDIAELYWLEIPFTGLPPVRDSLKRMMIGPAGAELTGPRFTPDGRTLFINVQHPSSSNPAPYNRSYTLAIWGYETPTGLIFDAPSFEGPSGGATRVKVNAASRLAYFDRISDVELFNAAGRRLERHKGVRMLDLQHLSSGAYSLRFKDGGTHRLVIQ